MLTAKQEAFCQEYLKDFNGSRAARDAGYSEKSAHVQASRLLRQKRVCQRLECLIEGRNERVQVDADYVLQRLIAIDQMDVLDLLYEDGAVKPVKEWPLIWRQYIAGLDVSEKVIDGQSQTVTHVTLSKLKWPDKVKNLEALGKHVSVQAFNHKLELFGGKNDAPIQLEVSPAEAYKRILCGEQES